MSARAFVVIPARDEEATLGAVLARVPAQVEGVALEPLVVDDGSRDRTRDIALADARVRVCSFATPRGLGAGVRFGLRRALELDAVAAAIIDADDEYLPEELPLVMGPVLRGEADYVIGSRFLSRVRGMQAVRRVGNALFTAAQSLWLRQRLSDGQSGMRAFSRRALEQLDIIHDYNYAQVMTLNLARHGILPVEVAIRYRVREHGHSFVSWRYLLEVPRGVARELTTPLAGRRARDAGDVVERPPRAGASP